MLSYILLGLVLAVFASGLYIRHLRAKTVQLENDLYVNKSVLDDNKKYIRDLEDAAIINEYILREEEDHAEAMSAGDTADWLRDRFNKSN